MDSEDFDPSTGEVRAKQEITEDLPSNGGYAADGHPIPSAALTLGQFIDMIEDGQFSHDTHREIADMVAAMTDLNKMTGNKQKGTITIKIVAEAEDGMFKLLGKAEVKSPELPRAKSHMWVDEHNNFTRFPPNQMQMFGLKHAGSGTSRAIRTV